MELTRMLDAAVDVWYGELMETLGHPDGSDYSVVTPHCMSAAVWTPHGPVVWADCHGMEDDHVTGLVNRVVSYLVEHDTGHDIVVDVVAESDYTPVDGYLYEQPGATALMLGSQIAPVLTGQPQRRPTAGLSARPGECPQ